MPPPSTALFWAVATAHRPPWSLRGAPPGPRRPLARDRRGARVYASAAVERLL